MRDTSTAAARAMIGVVPPGQQRITGLTGMLRHTSVAEAINVPALPAGAEPARDEPAPTT